MIVADFRLSLYIIEINNRFGYDFECKDKQYMVIPNNNLLNYNQYIAIYNYSK